MSTISAAIAVFNEEENIETCLKSIESWIDEIVIVDGSSTDQTVSIVRKFKKILLIEADNPQMFHINKQKAIDACTSTWVLQLDADEIVSAELKKEILTLINNDPLQNGFWIPRKNFFLGRYLMKGGQYPDYTLRLYRRGKGCLPCENVHEQARVEGELGYLTNPLIHMADPSFERYLSRFNRYTTHLAHDMKKQNISYGPKGMFSFFFIKPIYWFILSYFRHKGLADGFPGFVFSFFSSLRFPAAYVKYWERKK